MDHFAEYLVQKRPTSQDRLKQGLIVAAAVVLSVLIGAIAVLTGWLFLLVLVIGAIYGAYYLLTGCYTEYEYTVTNGELDVDKIAGRRKRSHLLTVPVSKFTGFGVYTDQTDDPSDATLFLCSDNTGENAYYADFTTEEYGTARLIFTPNEEMVQTIVLLWLGLASLLLFGMMGADKKKAKRGQWRIPEKTLFLVAICGGAVGGTLGMYQFHHKTKHRSFQIGFPFLAVLQLLLLGYLWMN